MAGKAAGGREDSVRILFPEPNEKQKRFFLDEHRYVAFGGARGGGKSWAVRVKAVMLALVYGGIRIMIVRRSYSELKNNHIDSMKEMLLGVAEYMHGAKEFVFPNKSVIMFGYLSCDRDLERYQGLEYDVLFIDEATQISEFQFSLLCASVRGVNSFPKRIYLTCNPGGQGHSWVKRLFVDRNFNENEHPEDYSFIISRVYDNKVLTRAHPEYIKQLQSLPEKQRRAWLDGDWNIFEGQFFEEFRNDPEHYADRRYTHVIDPFPIPPSWRIYRSFDFGYAKPFSCGWWAVDHDGVAYRIAELYGCTSMPNEGVKWTPDRIFREIAEIEKNHPDLAHKNILGVADPSIWDASRGEAIIESAMRRGIYFSKGDNRRIPGWMQMHYRMALDSEGFPMMYIFKGCRAFIRTIPQMHYSKEHPEDLDSSLEDHVADEARYFFMSRPIATPKE